jgi:uncharacterized protein YciI
MPFYEVWYRDIPEPLEFTTASRYTESEILDHILANEQIAAPGAAPSEEGQPVSPKPSVSELIAQHKLAPVRYTEDGSEINTIH